MAGPKDNFGTRAVHVGAEPDANTGAVINPISLSTTFAQSSPAKPLGKFEYSRSDNPNRNHFEVATASLEQGSNALAYSSGSAATANVLQSFATNVNGKNAHVVSVGDVYGGTHRYFTKVAAAQGVDVTFSHNILAELEGLVRPETRLVWIETPSNPTLSVTDIAAVAAIVRRVREKSGQQLLLVVDNTFMSPYIQQPLLHGADLIVHSVTKYLNGHSDVVMGLVVVRQGEGSDALHERLRFMQNAIGAVPSPFDSWLAHRGLKTLHLRLRQAALSATAIAEFLESRIGSGVLAVNYPGLKSNPQRAIVERQHRDGLGGGMISVRVAGGAAGAAKFCEQLRLFALAESLGGIESLAEVPAVMTHAGIPREQREQAGVFDDLVRLSVGIEDTDDLLADVTQALNSL